MQPSGAPRPPRGPLAAALAEAFDPARHKAADVAAVLGALGGAHPVGHRAQLGPALAWALAQRPDVPAFLAALILRELGPLPSVVRRGSRHLRRAEARDVVAYVCWLRREELPHVDPLPQRSHPDPRKLSRVLRAVRRSRWWWRTLPRTHFALCSFPGFPSALAWAMRAAPSTPARSWVAGVTLGLYGLRRERIAQSLPQTVCTFGGVFVAGALGSAVYRGLRNGRLPLDVYGRLVNALRAELGKPPLAFGSEAP